MSQQILVRDVTAAKVKLEFNLMMGTVQSLLFDELDSSLIIQLPVLDVC